MINNKLNGLGKWILIAIAILTIAYNTIVTHAIKFNDFEHQKTAFAEFKAEVKEEFKEVKADIRDILNHLLKKD